MFNNLRHNNVLSVELLEHLCDVLERELHDRYRSNISKKTKSLDLQKILDTMKPKSSIKTDVLKNYRFKN